MSNGSIFPYLPQTSNSPGQTTSNDLIINKAFPAVIFEPTEANGVYQEFVEVNGASCLVTNATWNANNLRWQQDSPCNNANPAYLLALGSNGAMVRFKGAATNVPNTPVNFLPLFEIDANGLILRTPSALTASGQTGESTAITWDPGSSIVMDAENLFITDTASDAASTVNKIAVNSTIVWSVRKDGTLTVGHIPYSLITGAPAPFNPNNPHFTGTATFDGPIDANGGIVATDVSTGTLEVSGASALHAVSATDVTANNLNVSGNSTLNNLSVTGSVSLPSSAIPVSSIAGTGNIGVTHTGSAYTVDGSALTKTVSSGDNSLSVNYTGQNVDLRVSNTHPVSGQTYATAINFAAGSTAGSLTFSNPLPGNSSNTYIVVASGSLQFQNGGRNLTMTGSGSGVTWPSSPQLYQNANAGTFPFTLYGIAEGGSVPSVAWTCNDVLFNEPMTMVMVAYFQS